MTERQLGALVPAPIPSVLATANVRPAEPPGRLSATPLVVPTNPPQPDVHVSIGRIEVRANEPSAAAPAHPHTTTPLGVIGLDDYLAQRGRP